MRKNKNIWLISQYSGTPHYGMNYRGYYLAKEFVKAGDKVTIFSGSYSHLFVNYPQTQGLFTEEKIDGINFIWVRQGIYKGSKSIGRVLGMLGFMFKLFFFNIFKKEKPDVIIISSLSLFPVLNAYLWSKIFKIEFIFEVRDIWPLTLMEVGGFSKYHPLVLFMGWFEKLGYRKAQYVTSVLASANKHMIQRGMEEQKFRYIPNGINFDEVSNAQALPKEIADQIPQNKFIIGYLGTMGIANALEYLLEAAKLMQNQTGIHFVLVGQGGEKEVLESFCFDHRLKNITFINAIAKVQVQSMLSYFDVCYIGWHKKAIYQYGISANKIFDYMYSAKPIINAIGIENDIICEANCGLSIEAENPKKIVETIETLYVKSSDELKEIGNKGKSYVLKHHQYEELVKRYHELMG